MGARIKTQDGRLPVDLYPSVLRGIEYRLPVASAQVKSAILLAALGATGKTTIMEPTPSRDHTERMLAAFGARLDIAAEGGGRRIAITGGQRLVATSVSVPGDPSSAAFLAAAAAIAPASDVLIRDVLVNPLRTGFYETLKEMGAAVEFVSTRTLSGEPVADVRVRHAPLKAVVAPESRAASMIDEYPVLAVVAAFAAGTTRLEGLAELRVKESDRLAAVEEGLKANGVAVRSGPDWLEVDGRNGDVAGGGLVKTRLDHRIAMSFLVMGMASEKPVSIDDGAMIATSFPRFVETMRALGGVIAAQ
jgi:3-phosphoshikimate 1-carboxyvinyltransferase